MRLSRIWVLLALAALAGCVAPQSRHLLAEPGVLPVTAEITSVPFVAQERFYCGPAALTMALAWSGLDVTQDEIAAEVYTPGRQGTLRSDVLAVARRHGRLAVTVPTLPALLGEIAAGHPVIIFQNLGLSWVAQWHFAVAIGYDLAAGEILLHSGLKARKSMSLSTFERGNAAASGPSSSCRRKSCRMAPRKSTFCGPRLGWSGPASSLRPPPRTKPW